MKPCDHREAAWGAPAHCWWPSPPTSGARGWPGGGQGHSRARTRPCRCLHSARGRDPGRGKTVHRRAWAFRRNGEGEGQEVKRCRRPRGPVTWLQGSGSEPEPRLAPPEWRCRPAAPRSETQGPYPVPQFPPHCGARRPPVAQHRGRGGHRGTPPRADRAGRALLLHPRAQPGNPAHRPGPPLTESRPPPPPGPSSPRPPQTVPARPLPGTPAARCPLTSAHARPACARPSSLRARAPSPPRSPTAPPTPLVSAHARPILPSPRS